jgi:hypothetical protein
VTLNPVLDLPPATTCRVVVAAAHVHDLDSVDPPDAMAANYTLTFTTDAAPTDIGLTNTSIAENLPSGTPVGTFSSTDADAGDTHTYTLVAGVGSTDNASFTIFGAQLRTAASFDFETKSSYSIRVRTTDNDGLSFEKQFTITVNDANEAPTVTTSPGSTPVVEDAQATIDAALTVADVDDANLESAQVRVSSGFQSGDDLIFVNTASISGVYNTGTGVLTMTGTATKADYEAALRSIKFRTTNDNPTASKTVEFKVNDGALDSAPATKGITVTPANDAPTLTTSGGAASYTEGGSAVAVDSGIAASDPDSTQLQGGTVSITSNFSSADGDSLNFTNTAAISGTYNSSTGVLTLTGNATVASYQTALRSITFSNTSENPSIATRTVSFQVTDTSAAASNVATRNVTVATANDAPVVTTSPGSTSYTEGDPATTIDGSITVTDADDTNLESAQARVSANFESGDDLVFVNQNGISGVYNTGTGVLTMTGTSTVANYETAFRSIQYRHTGDNPASSKTIEFKANDGDVDSNAATKSISVTAANDAPTLTASAGTASYTEGGAAAAVDPGLTATDPDSAQLQSATVSITSNFSSADGDSLNFVNQNGISGSYNSGTGVLSLTGNSSVANYQTALRSITFTNTSENPSTATRTVSFQVTDSSAAASNVVTRDVTVAAANDAPVVTTSGGSTSYSEGAAATPVDSGVTVTDADDTNLEGGTVRISSGFQSGDDLVFVNQNGINGVYNTGTGVLTLTGTSSVANYQTALRSIAFQTTNGAPVGSKTIEFKVNDGDVDSNAATKEIDITSVNSAPVLTATVAPLAYSEGAGAVAVDPGLTATDADSTEFGSATVQITSNFVGVDDQLDFVDTGTITGSYNDTTGKLTLTGTDSIANYQAALRSVTYTNSSENPSGTKTVSFKATDVEGAPSNIATRDIALTGVNDAPTVTTSGGNAAYTEGGAAVTIDNGLTITDPDDTNLESGQVRLSVGFEAGDDLQFVNQNGISGVYNSGTGVLTLTGTSSVANYQTALRSIKFGATDNDPVTTKTVEFRVNDGSADSNLATRDITVTPTNDAPVADDETFNGVVGNTSLIGDDPSDGAPAQSGAKKTITADILDGDTDPDSPAANLTVTPGTFATNDGGTVTIEADGDFVFHPAAGTSCTDTSDFFDYTVEDNDATSEQTDTGRVTLNITGCVWYVNNSAAGNSGTSTAPFDTLAQAETASGNGHTVFVYDGNNTSSGYDTGFAMNLNERLIGESEGLIVGSDTLLGPNPGATPSLTASGEDVVDMAGGNEVKDFNIEPSGLGGGISAGAGEASGTIDDVNITDTGTAGQQPGLELNSTGGTWNISNLTVNNSGATTPPATAKGVVLNGAGTVNFASAGTISITTDGAAALDADTTNMGAGSVFDDITVTNSGSGGVRLFNTTGSTQLGGGSGVDLNLTTTSGANAALEINSGGTVSVPGAGTANIAATGGPAVDVTGTPGVSLSLDTVSSTNSASNGVRLSGLGTGTFSATGGTITGTAVAGTSFTVSGASSGDITYPGTLANGAGQTASITGRTGGTVTFSGVVQDTSDAGGGIVVSTNTGGTTVFSNPSKTLNTVNGNAVVFSASDGHTLSFTNGGLDIDTTTGKGLEATTSGTITVTGTGNTIDSNTGTALNITNTDIGSADVTFDKVASNGAANGIVLNNTANASGSFSVTGVGGTCTSAATCTGGAIQNSTGPGISLTSVPGGVNLTRVAVLTGSTDGINGAGVNGFALDNSRVASNGDAVGENGVELTQLSGTVSFATTTVTANADDNVLIANTSGNVNATFNGGEYSQTNTHPTTGGDAILLRNDQTGTMTVNIHDATFTNNRDDHVQATADADSGATINLTVNNNTMTNTVGQPGNGITVNPGGTSTTEATLTNNNIQGSNQAGITVDGPGSSVLPQPANLDATITGNTIGAPAVSRSGSWSGSDIAINSNGGMDIDALVQGNALYQFTNPEGLTLIQNDGVGSLNATVRGNTISNQAGTIDNLYGVRAIYGSTVADTGTGCLDLGGAGSFSNNLTGSSPVGSFDIRLRQAGPTVLQLPGYGGTSHDTTAVAAYLVGRNTTTHGADVSQPNATATYVNAAGCPLP